MEVVPARPGNVQVEGLLGQGVAEGGVPGLPLLQQPDFDQLGEAVLGRRAPPPAAGRPAGRGRLRPRPPRAPRRRARRRRRERLRGSCRGSGSRLPPPARGPSARSAGSRAGAAPRPSPRRRRASPWCGGGPSRTSEGEGCSGSSSREQLADPVPVEWLQRELLAAGRRGAARCAASAGGGRAAARRSGSRRSTRTGISGSGGGERREQLDRRFVRPLQVVEDDGQLLLGAEMGERAAHRLEDRRPFGRRRRRAELGQQQGEVGEERAAACERLRVGAQA